jgi:molecular chaperone Hsp33
MIEVPISDPVLLDRFSTMHPDGMTIFLLGKGELRGAFFHGTRFVNRLRAQHNLGLLETMVLGQASLAGALLIPTMKGRDRAILRYDTNGPAAGFSVEANSAGTVRGFLLQDPIPVEQAPANWDLAPYFGDGTLTVIRFPEGACEPVSGTVEIKHRNIARDLTEYFLASEQTQTAINTGIQYDREGRVAGAGALYLQTMPGADPDLVVAAERAFAAAPSLGTWFAEGGDREDIIFGLFRGMNPVVALERDIRFDCPCSREKFTAHLKSLDRKELTDMAENGPEPIEVVCHNCGSVYTWSCAEIREML